MKKEKLLTLVTAISLMLTLSIALPLAGGCTSGKSVYQIGVTQIVTHPALDSIRTGCINGLAEAGYVDGKNVVYDFENPEGDMSVGKTIADKFVSEKKDLIISLTTPCTQAVAAAAKDTGIPVVFIAVTDPVMAGIISSWEKPCFTGLHITGVSDYIPVKPQLDVIKEICPNAKKLGAIYNAGDESTTKTVNEMNRLAPDYGLEVIPANVSTSAETHDAAMSLVGKVDVMWMPMCNTAVAGLEGIISVCEEYKIPFFPPDPDSVRRGGIASVYYDNDYLGRLGAEKAVQILKGKDACDIPASTFYSDSTSVMLTLNPTAAGRMGVTIPQSLVDRASEVVQE